MDFAELTTLRVGGPAPDLLEAASETELVEAVLEADAQGQDVLVIGSGSHLVVSDRGWDGLLVRDARKDIGEVDFFIACGGSTVKATAGADWDTFVQFTLENELAGLEALSGIPGTVGVAPIQNLGAFGQEVAQTVVSVRALDRATGHVQTLTRFDMHLGYRSSIMKRSRFGGPGSDGKDWGPTGRWVVLEVTFQLRSASLSEPIRYESLADSLGVELGARAPAWKVREHVLELRKESGLLFEADDHDTWSAGSYFRNPILSGDDLDKLPEDAPRFPVRNQAMFVSATVHKQAPLIEGRRKIPAAWFMEEAGFEPGFHLDESKAALSNKDLTVITNRGGATAAEVETLADAVIGRVRDKFGVELIRDPVVVDSESTVQLDEAL